MFKKNIMKAATMLLMALAICQANLFDDVKSYGGKFKADGVLGDHVIMEPLPDKEGPAAALIFIIGAYCKQKAYVDHLKAV